jgi:glycosyltransferase involved in cell wall biosynthesis
LIIEKNVPMELVITTSHRIHDTLGGVEKFVESFSSWCDKRGIEITIVSRTLSVNPVKIINGPLNVHKNGRITLVKKTQLPFQLYYLGLFFFSFSVFVSLLRIVKKLRLQSAKRIIFHSQDINFAALATVSVGKLMKIPTIIHQHGPYEKLLPSKNMQIIELTINKITCLLSDSIIATDKYTKEYLTRINIKNEKICVIPAAVNSQFFENLEQKTLDDNSEAFRIGYVGRLSQEKNLEVLILGFKEFISTSTSSCKLIVVGDGSSKSVLEELTRQMGISKNVEFKGFQTDVRPFLSSFDIFVLPSKIEGTPISLLEAMAAGKAIIASNLPSIREIVINNEEALLFNPDNPKELANMLLKLHDSVKLRKRLGIQAKRKATDFDENKVFERLVELYEVF